MKDVGRISDNPVNNLGLIFYTVDFKIIALVGYFVPNSFFSNGKATKAGISVTFPAKVAPIETKITLEEPNTHSPASWHQKF